MPYSRAKQPGRKKKPAAASKEESAVVSNPTLLPPARKPRGRPPKALTAATLAEASAAAAAAPAEAGKLVKPAKATSKAAKEVKPRGKKKKAGVMEQLEPAEQPKGPAFAFEIDHVLALGSQCGLPMVKAARDEMSVAHHAQMRLHEASHSLCDKCQASGSQEQVPVESGTLDRYDSTSEKGNVKTAPQLLPIAELPLRHRLQKIQQLLLQAGVSPTQALLAPNTVSNSTSGMTSASTTVQSMQQRDTAIADHDFAHLLRSEQQAKLGSKRDERGFDHVTTPVWTQGVTYDKMICLISPSPSPVHQRLHTSQHSDPMLLPLDAQRPPLDPSQTPTAVPEHPDQNYDQLHDPVGSISPFGPQGQQQDADCQCVFPSQAELPSKLCSVQPHADMLTAACRPSDDQLDFKPASSPASGLCVEAAKVNHDLHGSSASCHQSPVSTRATQQNKKRSRLVASCHCTPACMGIPAHTAHLGLKVSLGVHSGSLQPVCAAHLQHNCAHILHIQFHVMDSLVECKPLCAFPAVPK